MKDIITNIQELLLEIESLETKLGKKLLEGDICREFLLNHSAK